ncbi:hypothetical protein SAMN04515671_1809 [Nakamurella panacisegetis]|uniref:Nitroreductase family protein n=1 Tax=Nakamurella panacisegetis TaxID=1090615 RepID=A0A1H0LUE1_9ACTN|nr:nitroreductase [Nakamurella panacisegetis]SDO71818.1 hypothetical protein SAMN04515671_1809 [Nakamurella panacisegetis]
MFTPVFGLSAQQTVQVLSAAGRAPSLHNSQPWAFRLTSDRIELHLDPARRLPASDPDGREARLACGAALFNLRLALARHGVRATSDVVAEPGDGPLAVVELGGDFALSPERAELERAIVHRRTNRRPFFDEDVPPGHRLTLARAAEIEGATLWTVSEPLILDRLAGLAESADRAQHADPAWLREWAAWTGGSGGDDRDPVITAGPGPVPDDPWARRDFGRPAGRPAGPQPLVAVLATPDDQPRSQVLAGQAMERVLLTATGLGLAASFVSRLVEVPSVRAQVAALIGGALYPQTVLRIGFGGPVPGTTRRAVEECLWSQPCEHDREAAILRQVR